MSETLLTISEKTRVPIALVAMLGTGLISGVLAYADLKLADSQHQRELRLHEDRLNAQRDRLKGLETSIGGRIKDQDETLSELRRRMERMDVNIMWMRDTMDERRAKGK